MFFALKNKITFILVCPYNATTSTRCCAPSGIIELCFIALNVKSKKSKYLL